MNTLTTNRSSRTTSFEDLKGLRAEAYIRDSTLDQRDGFGPDIQRNNEERFAINYGLHLGNRWYTEFVSGRSVKKRHQFHQFLKDARADLFDVLLVDHTSRFGRNQAECIRYKEELQSLGKIVIFVSQGIISGSDRDFLSERINETLDSNTAGTFPAMLPQEWLKRHNTDSRQVHVLSDIRVHSSGKEGERRN